MPDEIRSFEVGGLIAIHPVLEAHHQRRVEPGHRKIPCWATPVLGAVDEVAERSLAFYEVIGQEVAQERRA